MSDKQMAFLVAVICSATIPTALWTNAVVGVVAIAYWAFLSILEITKK